MRVLIIGWVSAAILFVFGVTFTFLTFRSAQGGVTPGAQSGAVPYSIVVGADGMASASPDVGYVALGVDTPARTAEEATAANSQAMTAVIQAIKGQGVPDKDIRTTEFSVTPVYAPQKPGDSSPPAINGYRVRNSVRLTVENVQDVGKVLDAALQGKANSGVSVSLG